MAIHRRQLIRAAAAASRRKARVPATFCNATSNATRSPAPDNFTGPDKAAGAHGDATQGAGAVKGPAEPRVWQAGQHR